MKTDVCADVGGMKEEDDKYNLIFTYVRYSNKV